MEGDQRGRAAIGLAAAQHAGELAAQAGGARLGCAAAGPCGVVLLSRFPVGQGRFNAFPSGPDRMVRAVVEVPGHGAVALAGIHETKPW